MAEDDRERFERLFRDQYDAVLRFALARAEPELAEDAAAETFAAAWQNIRRLPDPPQAWLLHVARRKVADQYRVRSRRDRLASRLTSEPDEADPAEQVSDGDQIRTAFARLRPGDQELLRLIAWDDLSPDEAAQVLGCSKAGFAVRLHRARRRLRAALDDVDGPSIVEASTVLIPLGVASTETR